MLPTWTEVENGAPRTCGAHMHTDKLVGALLRAALVLPKSSKAESDV